MMIIDTDVHEYLGSAQALLPYMAAGWEDLLDEYGWTDAAVGSDLDLKPTIGSSVGLSSFPYTGMHTTGRGRLDWVLPDGSTATDVDVMRQHLFEGEGVTHAILNGLFHVGAQRGNYEFAAAVGAAYNDWQIDQWLKRDTRFFGSVHVVPDDPIRAAEEIDRVAGNPQIVQVFLPTVTDTEYGAPRYRPIFEAAVRHDLVVTFHHGAHTKTVLGYPRHRFEWHSTAAPEAAINQIVSVVANGLFEEFPELKMCFLETGVAWLPWLMWRADQQYEHLKREVPWLKKPPSHYIRDHIRLSTQPITDVRPDDFVTLVQMTKSEQVFMFATDYPHFDADSPNHALSKALPETLRQRIAYGNALDSYPRLRDLSLSAEGG